MNAFDKHVAPLFRRGIPTGEQRELLVAWALAGLMEGGASNGPALAKAMHEAIERGIDRLRQSKAQTR